MKKKLLLIPLAIVLLLGGCSRFRNAPTQSKDARYIVISPIYNEIIWALGAQDKVVGVDLSTTYPPEVRNVQTVGYHRALSAEGILSLHPTTVIHDNRFADHIVVLNEARVVAHGTVTEVLTAERIQEVFGVTATFMSSEDSGIHIIFN